MTSRNEDRDDVDETEETNATDEGGEEANVTTDTPIKGQLVIINYYYYYYSLR